MNREQLNKILENHKHWIYKDCEGWEDMRADLRGADLRGVDLRGVDLCDADLRKADLRWADFRGANLDGADFRGADLFGASFWEEKNTPFIPTACPEEGVFIGYKKAQHKIVKLEICNNARRSSATGRKCRCDKAKVLSITKLDGSPTIETEVRSDYDENFIYKVGEIVEEPNFCEDRFEECAEGIHFFINRQEAVEY